MFIKHGAQYTVYSIFGRRVFKVPNTKGRAIRLWKNWAKTDQERSTYLQKALLTLQAGKDATTAMRLLCKAYPEVKSYLGEPIFLGGCAYAQQRAETLDIVFARQSLDQNVRLLKQYVETLLFEWRYGFSDSVFNITLNTGMMTNGKLALIDFGEITVSKSDVEELIKNKVWLKSWSYKVDMSKDLRREYKHLMARTLTLENLDRNWRTLV